ncbi:MAG: putative PEP-binding protein, partial [Promethearchaeota archaeon]
DIFSQYLDGFSIGSNDLTQLTYGVGRDNEKMIPMMNMYNYNTNSESIRRSVSHLIKTAHEYGRKVGICGQAPSDDPDFLRFLVREGIDSLSLNFDTYARGRINTWRTEIIEAKLNEENRIKSYEFLNECDKLIEKIRVPRGKLRNMVRKQGKNVNQKLMKRTEQFNQIFDDLQELSYNYVKQIDIGISDKFDKVFDKFNNQIKVFTEKIPDMKREIREFGIY